jgi:hypothetical protein
METADSFLLVMLQAINQVQYSTCPRAFVF